MLARELQREVFIGEAWRSVRDLGFFVGWWFGWRLPHRRFAGELIEFFGRAAVGEPVGHITLRRQMWQVDDADAAGGAVQALGDRQCVRLTGLVIVGKDRARDVGEIGIVSRRPFRLVQVLRCTAGVGGGDQQPLGESVRVLLALDDVAGGVLRRAQQVRQAVRHSLDAVHLPDPAAIAIGPTLAEVLRFPSRHLEGQHAVRVVVVVGLHDAGFCTWASWIAVGQEAMLAQPTERTPALRAVLVGRESGLIEYEIERAAADLALMVEPRADVLAADLDGQAAVAAEAQAGSRRQ